MKKKKILNENSKLVNSENLKVNALGNRLIEARKSMNLTQQDIADKLCLKLEMIRNIEINNMPPNLAPVFFLGYIRSYARLVNILDDDLSDLMLEYKYCNVLYTKNYVKVLYLENKRNSSIRRIFIFLGFLFITVFSLFCFFFNVFKTNKLDNDVFIINKK